MSRHAHLVCLALLVACTGDDPQQNTNGDPQTTTPPDQIQCVDELDCEDPDECTIDTCINGFCVWEPDPECDGGGDSTLTIRFDGGDRPPDYAWLSTGGAYVQLDTTAVEVQELTPETIWIMSTLCFTNFGGFQHVYVSADVASMNEPPGFGCDGPGPDAVTIEGRTTSSSSFSTLTASLATTTETYVPFQDFSLDVTPGVYDLVVIEDSYPASTRLLAVPGVDATSDTVLPTFDLDAEASEGRVVTAVVNDEQAYLEWFGYAVSGPEVTTGTRFLAGRGGSALFPDPALTGVEVATAGMRAFTEAYYAFVMGPVGDVVLDIPADPPLDVSLTTDGETLTFNVSAAVTPTTDIVSVNTFLSGPTTFVDLRFIPIGGAIPADGTIQIPVDPSATLPGFPTEATGGEPFTSEVRVSAGESVAGATESLPLALLLLMSDEVRFRELVAEREAEQESEALLEVLFRTGPGF